MVFASEMFKICATLQVIPKSEILRLGVLEQSKEEVIVQVGSAITLKTMTKVTSFMSVVVA